MVNKYKNWIKCDIQILVGLQVPNFLKNSLKVDKSVKIGTKVVYSSYFKNLVLATKNAKMAAKNPRWPPNNLVFPHYFPNYKYF